jgi:hypothetical protein
MRERQKGQERKEERKNSIILLPPALPPSPKPLACSIPLLHLGGNFPTSVAAKKSITAWSHSSMVKSSEICTCRHLPAFQPVACPTVFQSVFCCSGGRGAPASGAQSLHTTSICRHLGGRTALGRLQWAHARTSVCRTWWPAILRLLLG